MKVVHIGNIGNFAYNIVKYLRRTGIEADVVVRRGAEPTADPTNEDPGIRTNPPSWLIYWEKNPTGYVRLTKTLMEYDLIQGYAGAPMFLQFLPKPYVAHSTGYDMRVLALQKTVTGRLMKRAYEKAKVVFFSNPDQLDAIDELGLKEIQFIPFIVDIEKYAPKKKPKSPHPLLLFHPSRLDWKIKGNDIFLRAYAKFVKQKKNARGTMLLLVDWGVDKEKTKELIKREGIEENVRFLPQMDKNKIADYYHKVDVVVDQFILGSYGLAGLEAMACGKAVLGYVLPKHFRRCYGGLPPIINAKEEHTIHNKLVDIAERRIDLAIVGKKSREWVMEHHAPEKVIAKIVKQYNRILG